MLSTADGLFLEIAKKVAGDYPDIGFDYFIVDDFLCRMIAHPEDLDVVVTPNLYGDILSDGAAGMIGGLSGSLMSYPFEMWRAAQMHNRSFKDEMLAKGPKRLLAGWAPGATRLVITSGVMGELLPRMKAWSNQASEATKKQSTPASA